MRIRSRKRLKDVAGKPCVICANGLFINHGWEYQEVKGLAEKLWSAINGK
jgi:hypothetical protein